MLPADAVYPKEKEPNNHMPMPRKSPFLDMTNLYSAPGTADTAIAALRGQPEAQALFEAQIAYSRGNVDAVYQKVQYFLDAHSGFYAIIGGNKTLTGRDLLESEFSFELYETDENWTTLSDAVTASNNSDGSFSFPAIRFTEEDIRYYLIKEVNGGQVINGVTYDDTVYYVTVDVTDNGTGALEYTLDTCTDDGEPVEAVTFENSYVEPPPETGDTGISLWVALMTVSCGAIVTTDRITHEVEGVNRVLLDLTPKSIGTIEWE